MNLIITEAITWFIDTLSESLYEHTQKGCALAMILAYNSYKT